MTFTEIKKQLQTKTVGIAGAGGLGSNCAMALARTGIGKLIIADFDTIDEGNLNRQYYFHYQIGQKKVLALQENIGKANPGTIVEVHDTKLTKQNIPALFKHCDLIIEAFDRAKMKGMIIETVLSDMQGKTIICGSGMAGFGNTNALKIRKIDNLLYICGDEKTEVSENCPPLAARVGIVANMQANLAIELLLHQNQTK